MFFRKKNIASDHWLVGQVLWNLRKLWGTRFMSWMSPSGIFLRRAYAWRWKSMISAWELFVMRQSSSSGSVYNSSSSSYSLLFTSSIEEFSNISTASSTSISHITWSSLMLTQFVTMDENSCTDSFLPWSSAMDSTRLGGFPFPLFVIAQLIFPVYPESNTFWYNSYQRLSSPCLEGKQNQPRC